MFLWPEYVINTQVHVCISLSAVIPVLFCFLNLYCFLSFLLVSCVLFDIQCFTGLHIVPSIVSIPRAFNARPTRINAKSVHFFPDDQIFPYFSNWTYNLWIICVPNTKCCDIKLCIYGTLHNRVWAARIKNCKKCSFTSAFVFLEYM